MIIINGVLFVLTFFPFPLENQFLIQFSLQFFIYLFFFLPMKLLKLIQIKYIFSFGGKSNVVRLKQRTAIQTSWAECVVCITGEQIADFDNKQKVL